HICISLLIVYNWKSKVKTVMYAWGFYTPLGEIIMNKIKNILRFTLSTSYYYYNIMYKRFPVNIPYHTYYIFLQTPKGSSQRTLVETHKVCFILKLNCCNTFNICFIK